MNEISPCKGCTDRHPLCHGSCDAYKEWHERYVAQQKHLEANKGRWQSPWSAAREKTARANLLKSGMIIRKKGGSPQ